MTTHLWGDKWFIKNGSKLNEAMDIISTSCPFTIMKEKYGTIRYEYTSSWFCEEHGGLIFQLFIGGFIVKYHRRFPDWLNRKIRVVDTWLSKLASLIGLYGYINRKRKDRFDNALLKVMTKYPEIAKEVTMHYPFDDGPELIVTTMNKQWSKVH